MINFSGHNPQTLASIPCEFGPDPSAEKARAAVESFGPHGLVKIFLSPRKYAGYRKCGKETTGSLCLKIAPEVVLESLIVNPIPI